MGARVRAHITGKPPPLLTAIIRPGYWMLVLLQSGSRRASRPDPRLLSWIGSLNGNRRKVVHAISRIFVQFHSARCLLCTQQAPGAQSEGQGHDAHRIDRKRINSAK
jgi:hypothetical protein